jgi:hypothetical protein
VEAYADPFTGSLYDSSNADGGTNPPGGTDNQTNILFKSTDGGVTWNDVLEMPAAWTPIVMTSTPNGRVFLFSANGSQPTLWYSNLDTAGGTPSFSGPFNINYMVANPDGSSSPIPSGADGMAFAALEYKGTLGISRESTSPSDSKIRVTYPFVDQNGKTAMAIVGVSVAADGAMPVTVPLAIEEGMSNRSVLQTQIIDGADLTRNDALLAWIEASCAPALFTVTASSILGNSGPSCASPIQGTQVVRYAMLHDDTVSPPGYLSQSGGLARTVSPPSMTGHYTYGGSFCDAGYRQGYFVQWSEGTPPEIRGQLVFDPTGNPCGAAPAPIQTPPVALTCAKINQLIAVLSEKKLNGTATPDQLQQLAQLMAEKQDGVCQPGQTEPQ